MARRRKDKFLREMSQINRDRKKRKAQRLEQRMHDRLDPWAGLRDGAEFRTREFKALGKDVGKGVVRESGSLGKDVLVEGASLAVDFMTTFLTLGTAPSASPFKTRSSPRRRRRR